MRAPNLSPIIRNFGGLDFFFFYQYLSPTAFGIKYYVYIEKNSQN